MSNYFSYLKKNFSFSNIIKTFIIIYLPIFSFGIFAPTEIFFANHAALGVIFDEFGWKFLGYGTLLAAIISLISLFFPKMLQKILLVVLWWCLISQISHHNFLTQIDAALRALLLSVEHILQWMLQQYRIKEYCHLVTL